MCFQWPHHWQKVQKRKVDSFESALTICYIIYCCPGYLTSNKETELPDMINSARRELECPICLEVRI